MIPQGVSKRQESKRRTFGPPRRPLPTSSQHLDVTQESDWADLIAKAELSLGLIDILINNAGVVGFSPVDKTDLTEWNRVIGINLT